MKPSKFSALISDIDGTLVRNSPTAIPTKKVINSVKKASKLIHVGVATSRPFEYAEHVIKMLNISAPCIVGGGSQIIDPNTKNVLWEQRLNSEQILSIQKVLLKRFPYLPIFDDKNNKIPENIKDYSPLQLWLPAAELSEAEEMVDLASSIPNIALNKVPSYTKGKTTILITDIRSTKQHAILEVAKILNIKTETIIGVGDGYNDFPLLMACGLKVAMGNAVPELKEIADYVAPTVEEDGVSHIIEKFILHNE